MLAVVLLGNLLWLIVGYGGIPGARTGTATMVISRAAFGRQGNVIPSLLSWLTVVGWEAVNLVLGSFALFSLMELLGFPLDTAGKAIALLVVTVLTFGVAILGHATIVSLQRVFTWALALVMLGLIPQVWVAPPLPVAADAATRGVVCNAVHSFHAYRRVAGQFHELPRRLHPLSAAHNARVKHHAMDISRGIRCHGNYDDCWICCSEGGQLNRSGCRLSAAPVTLVLQIVPVHCLGRHHDE